MISSEFMTKEWRHDAFNCANISRSNSMRPENFQRQHVQILTKIPCEKTVMRLCNKPLRLVEQRVIKNLDDEFEYTETFDGKQMIGNTRLLYNFKMVSSSGGSQTRTLRQVYDFIKIQQKFLKSYPQSNIVFVNILDGDESFRKIDKFTPLKSPRIFIGDSMKFSVWLAETLF